MSDTFATTARPTSAAIAWATKDNIFVEIPCKDGPPLITRYAKSIDGLQSALNILLQHPEKINRTIPKDHPKIKRPDAGPYTERQRESVRGILKRLKITGG